MSSLATFRVQAGPQSLSERINSLAESQTLEMAKKARQLRAKGIDVISLNLGEPDFQTPQHIKEAAKKAIDEGFTFYTPVAGIPELRKGIAEKLCRENHIQVTAENIVVSTGAKQSLANVLLCLINPGDEVIIFAPFWVSYLEMVKLAEGKPVIVSGALENEYKVTAQQLQAAITPKTKAIMFSSPCNPTGAVFSRQELTAIARVVKEHEENGGNPIYIIADEIYEYINFTGEHFSIGSLDFIKDNVITVNGFSKGFAMTGWRVGYMAGPKWLADACDKMQGQVTSGTCSIAQKAALAAITGDLTPTLQMAQAYRRRRDLAKELLQQIPGIKTNHPEGAFYIFPDVSAYFGKSFGNYYIGNSYDLCMYLLNEAHVSIVDGDSFGAPNCVRISTAAADEQIKQAISRIGEALAKLA
ncbi:MAG: pyridoxal phosphate-dependent aminotransferase [Cytophagales bacterium]|nr:pyridoxal phosphate-dependent aminotransferase [Bernardetiaceae bacterium]MDW8211681.1 pyridoxal phosphate-dependent aminotransferase [Cytophagales bacterium]